VTPLIEVPELNVWLKDERALPTGSFKVRGAAVWQSTAPPGTAVVTASSGNHALALNYVLQRAGSSPPLTVVVADSADLRKVDRLRIAGCEVVVVEGGNHRRDAHARWLAKSRGAEFCSSHDDDRIIAGQATVGLEILAARSGDLTVFVPVGGGGLFAGTLLASASHGGRARTVGVQPRELTPWSASSPGGREHRVRALLASARRFKCLTGLCVSLWQCG
jgi:threonine dehydratase